jgi:cbb3-type cytochrome oxidase subunit 1
MDHFVVRFLRASLLWLGAGVSLGVAMAVHPAWQIYRTAHLHMLLLGFVTMMIAGVAYHVLPRFAATTLYSRRLASAHLVVANVGLVLLAGGFIVRFHLTIVATPMLAIGGTLSAAGALMMAWNLWRTLDQAAVLPSALPTARPDVADRAQLARARIRQAR